jgi:hypothetical protein
MVQNLTFFTLFSRLIKAKRHLNALIEGIRPFRNFCVGTAPSLYRKVLMKGPRELAENVWYEVRTEINVGEPLFRLAWAVVLFYRVLIETKAKFGFEMRGLVLDGARLAFYIKPANGLELPKIMQWLKQTFSLRFNVRTGRKAHLWGERYWSEILAGEPPEEAEEVDWEAVVAEAKTPIPEAMAYALSWDSLRTGVWEAKTSFSPKNQPSPAFPPG